MSEIMHHLIIGDDEFEVVDAKLRNIFVTPEMFGAVGDGVTDDTAAIQAAIDSKQPIILTGFYNISDLTINKQSVIVGHSAIPNDLRLMGSRSNKTHVGFNVSGTINVSYGENAQTFYGNLFNGILFIGNGENDPIVNVSGSNHVKFENCGFYNAEIGLQFVTGQYSDVVSCTFANFTDTALNVSDNYIGLKIDKCFFDNNGNGSIPSKNYIVGSTAIKCATNENLRVTNTFIQGFEDGIITGNKICAVISGCRFEMFGYGVQINGEDHIISHCSFNRYAGDGSQSKKCAIVINNTASKCVVEKCHISNSGVMGIFDYGTNSKIDLIQTETIVLPEISETTTFRLAKTIGAQNVCYLGIKFQKTINQSASTANYWMLTANCGSAYKNLVAATDEWDLYSYAQNAFNTNAQTNTFITLTFTKKNSAETIPAGTIVKVMYRPYLSA